MYTERKLNIVSLDAQVSQISCQKSLKLTYDITTNANRYCYGKGSGKTFNHAIPIIIRNNGKICLILESFTLNLQLMLINHFAILEKVCISFLT